MIPEIYRILSEENELYQADGKINNQNIKTLLEAALFVKKYLFTKDGVLFLTVDSLISINNIITKSKNHTLRKCEVKPAGYNYQYMESTKIEDELYRLIDSFNEKRLPESDFCKRFLKIHPFKDGNGRTCKVLFIQNMNTKS